MADKLVIDCSTGQVETQSYTPDNSVPLSVTQRQAKLALLAEGILDEAQDAITAAGAAAQIEWDSAHEFKRDHPLILGIGASLGLTSEQIDDLFREAAKL